MTGVWRGTGRAISVTLLMLGLFGAEAPRWGDIEKGEIEAPRV